MHGVVYACCAGSAAAAVSRYECHDAAAARTPTKTTALAATSVNVTACCANVDRERMNSVRRQARVYVPNVCLLLVNTLPLLLMGVIACSRLSMSQHSWLCGPASSRLLSGRTRIDTLIFSSLA
jgi:hypothetical protein